LIVARFLKHSPKISRVNISRMFNMFPKPNVKELWNRKKRERA